MAMPVAQAATIVNGLTFSVANSWGQGVGSNSLLGKAEVGHYSFTEARGLAEYNLAGLTPGSASITFNVFKLSGLMTSTTFFPFISNIKIVAYSGNNQADIADFQAPIIGTVDEFNTVSLFLGKTLTFDISSIYNTALANNLSSLGIRLQLEPIQPPGSISFIKGAVIFDDFRLTVDNQTAGVPEPMMVGALLLFSFVVTRWNQHRVN
ncbi:hypothetical protein [Leptolyngbya sp. 'hensonii']|uniref:hypothetical protein n=1 Tax=Leptolyngbya sp. 'hensonii' TaxID=1922337 RepID=UPI00118029FE|nr:hypothetical protein [Leptolyngbya sp. 'hensonii']